MEKMGGSCWVPFLQPPVLPGYAKFRQLRHYGESGSNSTTAVKVVFVGEQKTKFHPLV